MECIQIKELIPLYIQHSASEDETKAIEEHLCICHTCRLHLSGLMDEPPKRTQPTVDNTSLPNTKKNTGFLEYSILFLGIAILVFFFSLLNKK